MTKRSIPLLLSLVALPCAVYAQARGVETQKHLSGSVQSLKCETASVIVMIGVGDSRPRFGARRPHADYRYDEKGHILEATRYLNGKISERESFKYDTNGNFIEKVQFDSAGQAVEKIVHLYNAEGRQAESLKYDNKDRLIDKIVYAYDAAGRLIEKRSYKGEKLHAKAAVSYDSQGRVAGIIAYNEQGDIPTQIMSEYDDKANRVEKSRYGLKGDLEGKTITTFDSKGNVVVIDHYRKTTGPVWKWEFEYDEKGNVTREKFASETNLSVWLYTYEYDSTGNWTSRTRSQLLNDKGKILPFRSAVIYRSFKYFSKTNLSQTIADPDDNGIVGDDLMSMTASEIRPLRPGAALFDLSSGESLGRPQISGRLRIEIKIDPEGKVESAKVLEGGNILSRDETAVERSIKGRTYRPVLVGGIPMRVVDTMTIDFKIPKLPPGRW